MAEFRPESLYSAHSAKTAVFTRISGAFIEIMKQQTTF